MISTTYVSHKTLALSPLKHLGYAVVKSMTVCIALICVEEKQPRIVFCVDSRLDATYSSTDTAVKIYPIADAWAALLSGDDWNMAIELAKHLSRCIKSLSITPSTREEMFRAITEGTSTFVSSPFCNCSRRTDLIVGGFSGNEPLLICTGFDGGNPYTISGGDVAVVGSGSGIAGNSSGG
jgi:hypothetical protein